MKLPELLTLYARHPRVAALAKLLGEAETRHVFCDGLRASAAPVVFAALHERALLSKTSLFLLNDEEEAGYFYHDLSQMLGESRVLFLPTSFRRAVKYGRRDAANEVLRTEVLNALSGKAKGLCVVSYPAALSERVLPKVRLADRTLHLAEGGNYDLATLEHLLRELGFERRDYVYQPGEYALRGSILDVYSFAAEFPYRIDFFGDDVDSIRTFEVNTQLSKERLREVDVLSKVDAEAETLVPLTDYLPAETIVFAKDFGFCIDAVSQIYKEGFSRQALAEEADNKAKKQAEWEQYEETLGEVSRTAAAPPELDKQALLADGPALREALAALPLVEFGTHASNLEEKGKGEEKPSTARSAKLHFSTGVQPIYHKNFELLIASFRQYLENGYRLYIAADSGKQHERLRTIFEEQAPDVQFTAVAPTLHAGFFDDDLKACFFTDHQIFDRFHKYNLRSEHTRDAKMSLTLKELMQFHVGDFIVHIDHGIGRFAGLVRVPAADGTQQEMIKLVYSGDDIVLVSIHSLHKLSKYKGREGVPPRLSHLGTGAWERIKERTKSKIKDIARDLIRLYAKRREEQGHAFSADTYMQQELEAGFAYEDTPDQIRVTAEVKADMESRRPMDRLVCGDVGFGKTEIAVRAALKAAVDGKQVAVLVPTTVLALQHYRTFTERLRDFPVRIDFLTRARSAQQTKALLADLADGKIDIVIGTHKLVGKQVKFKDLGLLIIDEEQKFGVAVKEKLRQLKVNVDTLTLTATPIPRTLQFSLMGARDLSVIQTPPPNRRPILTEVHTFSHEVIAEAINFEMSRNGQTFIVSNRIAALGGLEALVKKYVPDARVAVAHGQMPPADLEKIVLDFVNYEYDVLISTTIIENGIDIPNANTIVIDAAHRFGLSDLHQMRGRVGRSDRKAFCFLLAPPLALLKPEAQRRLQAIEEFSDLGAGIHLAMQDLDIRGAGNLLGAEQSGFIADLGYETYQKILSQAVGELKIEEFSDLYAEEIEKQSQTGDVFVDDCNVECDLHAFLPEVYVPGAGERMMLYRELDSLSSDEQIEAFRARLVDRFGPLPPEAEDLLRIPPLRRLGRRAGAERLVLKQGRMTLFFPSRKDSPFYASPTFDRLLTYATQHFRQCEFKEAAAGRRLTISGVSSITRAIELMGEILG